MSDKPIRVLVVEDSPTLRELLVHILGSDPRLAVAGTAEDGEAGVEAARCLKPDVITMDFHMPRMGGVEAVRRIMETAPVPIVVVSGSASRHEVHATFRMLDAGALVMIAKPAATDDEAARKLLETVRLMAEVKVVRRWPRRESPSVAAPSAAGVPARLVALGASTGGPQVLQAILATLPRDFPAPVVIVQHISPGFSEGFAEWLTQTSGIPVRLARHGALLAGGQAWLAPEGHHMLVTPEGRISLSPDPPLNGHRPSVSRLFASVAEAYGPGAVGVLLTGMGRDGAAELRLMRDRGALTIVQTPETAVVPGMPGEAIRLGAAVQVLAPEQIGGALRLAVRVEAGNRPGGF